jgi:hypothetical protein
VPRIQCEYGSSSTKHVCASYSANQIENYLDGPFKAARAFAILANIFIGAGSISLLKPHAPISSLLSRKGCGWLFIIGSVFETLTFLLYASKVTDAPYNGSFWWGSGRAIAASIAALLAGILTIRLPRSEHEQSQLRLQSLQLYDHRLRCR